MNRKNLWFEEAGNKLDPGLVEQLRQKRAEDPYEETSEDIPVIVRFKRHVEQEKKSEVMSSCQKDNHSFLDKEIGFEGTVSGKLSAKMIKEMKDKDEIDRIFYDREVKAYLDIATEQIGSAVVHEQGFTGKGVTIAVIDTGIHPHDDLTKPANRIVAFHDLINQKADPYDDNGHGTHCAGDAAGNGYLSNGKYTGPAPEAQVIGIKVLDENGSGRLSAIIEAISWCLENQEKHNIRVISLSLGAPAYESYREDPLSIAVQEAWHQGIVVCAAAGNSGPKASTISTPAINPFIITVGSAIDQNTLERKDDKIADYSSRGPTIDSLIKPDIYAPGTNIISLSAPDSTTEKQLPEMIRDEHYIQLSGTSMATPICAGVIAQMLEANPNLSPNDVKSILQTTAEPTLGDLWGYIEAKKAVDLAVQYQPKEQPIAEIS